METRQKRELGIRDEQLGFMGGAVPRMNREREPLYMRSNLGEYFNIEYGSMMSGGCLE